MAANAQMDQYIEDARVREVMDRYFLDKDETTPENTGKNYGPKQAEWRVRILPLPPEYRGAVADEGIQKWCAKTWPPIPVDWALQMRTWPTGRQLPGDLVDEGKLLLFMAQEVVDRAPRSGQRLALEKRRRTAVRDACGDDDDAVPGAKRRRGAQGPSCRAALPRAGSAKTN